MTPPERPKTSHVWQYAGLSALSGLFSVVPHGLAVHSGDLLGRVAGRLLPLRRGTAEDNLAAAFPDLDEAGRTRILRGLYRHLGRTLAEFCRYPVLNAKQLSRRVKIVGEDHLRRALEPGRGVFLLTGHLGNWEYLGAGLAARGFPMTFLVGPHRNKLAEELFNRYRAMNGVEVLVAGRDMRDVFKALKRGRVVATVADQDAGPDGYFIDFFGRPASTALGPFRIARRSGAPLILALAERHGMKHTVRIDAPIWSDPDRDAVEEARAWAAHYHSRLEDVIRAHPEQWFWVHRRWRSRPASEPDAAIVGAPLKLDGAEL